MKKESRETSLRQLYEHAIKFSRVTSDGCIETTRSLDGKGYGVIRSTENRLLRLHRLSFMVNVGDTGELFVCHKCDNRKCFNHMHLFLGTNKENMRDKFNKGRDSKGSSLPQSKLTEKDIPLIREMLSKGVRHKEIAAIFSVTRENIGAVNRSLTWKHVK